MLFIISAVMGAWFAMMAVHELGHVIGAYVTGGSVTRVVLHPLAISRTDVSPNPRPGIVVWLGPITGCLFPLCLSLVIPKRRAVLHNISRFFAGFCLIANGAYIGVGALDAVGDCREMLHTGTPLWGMITFGVGTVMLGLFVWHRLGSLSSFLRDPSAVPAAWAYRALLVLIIYVVAASVACSP